MNHENMGMTREMSENNEKKCPVCNGRGRLSHYDDLGKCWKCDGKGFVSIDDWTCEKCGITYDGYYTPAEHVMVCTGVAEDVRHENMALKTEIARLTKRVQELEDERP